ncbi:MAG: transposase [Pseudanabaena sp. Salubria-1]|nr:transposase [Pseudanabaena sp. Salubria-1]
MSIDEVSKRKGHKDFVTVVSSIDAGALGSSGFEG